MSVHGTHAAEEHGIRRSPHWHTVEKHFVEKNPFCKGCTQEQHKKRLAQVGHELLVTRGLQVHHEFPFHYAILLGRPDLELDERNLTVFCEDEAGITTEDHHNLFGHWRNFQSYDPDIEGTLAAYHGWSKLKLLANPAFLTLCSALPKTWSQLDDTAKQNLRKMLDQKYPKK